MKEVETIYLGGTGSCNVDVCSSPKSRTAPYIPAPAYVPQNTVLDVIHKPLPQSQDQTAKFNRIPC